MDELRYSHGITRVALGCHCTVLSVTTGEISTALVALDCAGVHKLFVFGCCDKERANLVCVNLCVT